MNSDDDARDVLGVSADAEPEVVEAAYRALMKKYHPDRYQGADGEERSKAINVAYGALRGRRSRDVGQDEPMDSFFTDPVDPRLVKQPISPLKGCFQAAGLSAALLAGLMVLARWLE